MSDRLQVVELVVTHPLVNILRGAMSILVFIVSHPYTASNRVSQPDSFGFRALKPAIALHPRFLEMLVSRLSSADHALCANALLLINSLMRDAITNDTESEWPKFVKGLQDLGLIKAVYILMQNTVLQDLSHPLLEFQALMKVQLRKWRDIHMDMEKSDHRRAFKSIHLASNPGVNSTLAENADDAAKKRHNLDKWKRLGFETDHPWWEFEDTGYLGMVDLTNYVRNHEDEFQKLLLEHSTRSTNQRCPIARASLAVTAIMYEHFEIEKADVDDAKDLLAFESRAGFDKVFRPLLLQWSVLHSAGMHAFFRLWQATGAEVGDFVKIVDLVRILLEAVVGGAIRTKELQEVEEEIEAFELLRLRQLQMELCQLTYEETWGPHLHQIRDELHQESLQFVKEQRVRCLLAGAWFPNIQVSAADIGPATNGDLKALSPDSHRYVKLSHNRRYLHYADFEVRGEDEPTVELLHEKLDLTAVTSVTSDVSNKADANSSTTTLKVQKYNSSTKITISGLPPSISRPTTPKAHTRANSLANRNNHTSSKKGIVLLTLLPQTQSLASEWLDGLLMLLNQQPITAETNRLITTVQDYSLKIRLLNVDFNTMQYAGNPPEIPSREGLDEDYYFEVFGN